MPDPRDPAHSTVGFMILQRAIYNAWLQQFYFCCPSISALNRFSVKFHGNKARYNFRDEKNKKSKQYLKI